MRIYHLLLSFILLSIIACMDQCTPRKNIPGPYYLIENETGTWELNYDLGGRSGIGRINSVKEIGWTEKYIFTKYDSEFYFLDKTRDDKFLNSDQIVIGPFNENKFKFLLDSLKISGFKLRKP